MEKQSNQGIPDAVKNHICFASIGKGIIFSYAATIPVFLIFSFILSHTDFPEKYISSAVIIGTMISVFTAGFIATRNVSSRGWLNGSAVGLIYVLVLYLVGSVAFGSFKIDKNVIYMTIICVLTSSIGGIICINLKRSSGARYKRSRK